MIKAQVMMQWGPGRTPLNTLSIGDSNMDITGQLVENIPPQKKLVNWEIWTSDLSPYEADGEIYIISFYEETEDGIINDNRNGVPPNNEFGQMRAYMAHVGIDQEDIKEAIGLTVHGRTRAEITAELLVWLLELTR